MKELARSFGLSVGLSVLVFTYVLAALGSGASLTFLILASIELAFSFDNAVINAQVLGTMSRRWRRLFLSIGIIVAIFGVRLLLPLVVVRLAAHLPMGQVVDLALHHPPLYAAALTSAQPSITAFGGAFLLMLTLHFFMADREIYWVRAIERPLSRLVSWWLPLLVSISAVIGLSLLPGNVHMRQTFIAGMIGVASYAVMDILVELLGSFFDKPAAAKRVGWAAFATLLYLELLDASLSFDGVIGAFAITNDAVLIALGLGVGAIWVRSLTVYMVRHRTLETYRYLEHGAHYAIGVLAVAMLLGTIVTIPDIVTGLLCLAIIAAAVITSRQASEGR